MQRIVKCNSRDYGSLVDIWESSVRATHDFLNERDIISIKSALIPDYFPNVNLYGITENDKHIGFIGLNHDKIEMLFINCSHFGNGFGSMLIEFAKRQGAAKVDVNEQNHYAVKFYQANGFNVTGRDETDDAGRPFPILHMSL